MTVTPTDVRQWLFRYLQGHMSWFDSPDWEVPGDKTIPRLVKAFEQLADYVATLRDDDPRFVSLADALNDADWTETSSTATSTATSPPPTSSAMSRGRRRTASSTATFTALHRPSG
jgi:hypothetical protein